MTTRQSATLRRRRLAGRLTELLKQSGMSAAQVDKKLDWNPGKLARILRGDASRPSLRDMADLMDVFGVEDERAREEIRELARRGRERDWWHAYKDMLRSDYTAFMGLEAGASSVTTFEPQLFPGLVQTPDYARAVMMDGPTELDAEAVEARLAIRMRRQELLTGEDPLRLWAIIDEAVLRRHVGGRAVQQAQLQHVLELSHLARVTFQVLPFSEGAHAGGSGQFTILEFPEEDDPDAAYVENLAGELLLEDPKDVARFKLALQRLQSQALSPRDSLAMIAAVAATS